MLWFILWVLLFYNDPKEHPFISDEERMFLEKSIGGLDNKEVSLMITYHVETSHTKNQRRRQNVYKPVQHNRLFNILEVTH